MVDERTESEDRAERVKIAGSGRISGGTYQSVKVAGSGVIDGDVTADSIEGDEIYLESTRSKMVRGKRVLIGPDCQIDRVEYEEEIHVHDEAEVHETVQR